jgi:putative pyruvate formate lyase activating enzyme
MDSSRREFFWKSATAAGGAWSSVFSCGQPGSPAERAVPSYLMMERRGELEKVEGELWEGLRNCRCCPRSCGANRLEEEKGVCGSTARLKIYSAGPHFGEERPLVGNGGSGTIFFSNCNLLCCYCQNWEINHRGDGSPASHADLARMMVGLQKRGCHNINLVTPTHVVPHIVKALRLAIPMGLRLPLVYNTGGYDSLGIVKKLDGIVDIYLPDFKYMDGAMAARYSSAAYDYPEVAAAVIREMNRQAGDLKTDERGIAVRGLMIRHLVLPNNISGTERFVQWVSKELSPGTYVNLMAQYRPEHKAAEYPELSRRLTSDEWRQALKWAKQAGLTRLDT